MGYLVTQTKSILKDGFKRQAEIQNCNADDLQIIIGLTKLPMAEDLPKEQWTNFPTYSLSKKFDYEKREQLDFANLTGKGLDGDWNMMPYEEICAEHLPKLISRIAKEKKLDAEKTEIFVLANNKNVDRLGLCIYHNKNMVKPIDFDYLFGDDEDTILTKEQYTEWFNTFIDKKVTV